MTPGVVDALKVVGVDHDGVNIIVVATGKCEFAQAAVHKCAAVADAGERVHGGRFVEFAVKGLFARVLKIYF